ncbi:acetylglutamate kinase [Bacillus carboniphilus]|uniref:Acetylglutamate kinase n=1 Tax=Bacillus carboniphilus TaxID=86663 RepID=A0ABN0WTV3_9BACI
MKYLVIKCGGSVLEKLPALFFRDIIQLQQGGEWQPIIVHGGGPLISTLLTKLGIPTKFVNGLRVTTEEVLDIVEMVLSGSVNKQIVRQITKQGGRAYGISGVDGGLLQTTPVHNADEIGFVGNVCNVNKTMIEEIVKSEYIPVISPVGMDLEGQRYNVNGDMAAAAIASSLQATLCMVSDIPGIYTVVEGKQQLLNQATQTDIENMISQEIIKGGMIPKVRSAIDALTANVPEVVILNGVDTSSLIDFTLGKEIGTKILLNKESHYAS